MTRKQLKAIRRAKAIKKKRNVRTNNMSVNPLRVIYPSHTYQLHTI